MIRHARQLSVQYYLEGKMAISSTEFKQVTNQPNTRKKKGKKKSAKSKGAKKV